MTFLKTENITYSDIMGQNGHSYNTEFKKSNCIVKKV